jgi:hypothetical protein
MIREDSYDSMSEAASISRRTFLLMSGAMGMGVLLGNPAAWAEEQQSKEAPKRIATNIQDALAVPRTKNSLPGPFPGKVIEVYAGEAMDDDRPVPAVINSMFDEGLKNLTGAGVDESFPLFFDKDDVVGIKVNPVGAGLISTRPEVVDVVIDWLSRNGLPKENIIIWDRFDFMLTEAGFTPERFPGIGIEGLQTMVRGEKKDYAAMLDNEGSHVSAGNFDREVFYWADVEGPKGNDYLNQHVFNDRFSYFGKLVTKKLTKIINIAVFKNSGNGISMATKNMGYGSICNTNRLHVPLFFEVNTEVLAFPAIRDKLALNIVDGLRAQYDGGPAAVAKFSYIFKTLFFATDPFALDMTCHRLMAEKRRSMEVKVNDHPRFTEYLRYGERLGLGIADPERIDHVRIQMGEIEDDHA